ncbi:hypothetical protein Tco_1210157 [Tanacetum coccineum]
MSFHQALYLIFELDEAAVGCTRDILRQRDFLIDLQNSLVVQLLFVTRRECLYYAGFFAVLSQDYNTVPSGSNGSSCGGSDMVIKDLDLEPNIDAMMREFLESVILSVSSPNEAPSHGISQIIQVHQSPYGIFISQSQYTLELLKKHGMDGCDTITTMTIEGAMTIVKDIWGHTISGIKIGELVLMKQAIATSAVNPGEAEYVSLSACCA